MSGRTNYRISYERNVFRKRARFPQRDWKGSERMSGKDFWIDFIRTYFMIVTLITIVMCIVGKVVMPEQTFGYEAFAAPLVNGFVGTIPNFVLYSKRELKVKELFVRKVIQLLLIEAAVLFVALYSSGQSWIEPRLVAILSGSVFVVFVVGTLISWIVDLLSAKSLTKELQAFQRENEG